MSARALRSLGLGFATLLAVLLAPRAGVMPAAAEHDALGHSWNACETHRRQICGTWTRQGNSNTWSASWPNGASATLTITLSGQTVTVKRDDRIGTSQGLQATYTGTLGSGGRIENGKVDWCCDGHGNRSGTWTATISGVAGVQPRRPEVLDHFGPNTTFADACRQMRNREQAERLAQLAALKLRELTEKAYADLDYYWAGRSDAYEWKFAVSLTLIPVGVWSGAALQAAGATVLQQLMGAAALSVGETGVSSLVEDNRILAAWEDLTKNDWKDGTKSDLLIEAFKSRSEAKFQNRIGQQSLFRLFALVDLIRRSAELAQTDLDRQKTGAVLLGLSAELGRMDGAFRAHGNNRAALLGILQRSGCPSN